MMVNKSLVFFDFINFVIADWLEFSQPVVPSECDTAITVWLMYEIVMKFSKVNSYICKNLLSLFCFIVCCGSKLLFQLKRPQ